MYFVAYLLDSKKHVVIPKTWVFDIKNHWEKFINHSINRNQKFLVFYSETCVNQEGQPDYDFEPDFNENCHLAKLIYFKANFEDANNVIARRRNVAPAVYNAGRLVEQPVPIVTQNENEDAHIHDENQDLNDDISMNESFENDASRNESNIEPDDLNNATIETVLVNENARSEHTNQNAESNESVTDPLADSQNEAQNDSIETIGSKDMQAVESSPYSLATTEKVSSNLVDNNDNELNCDTVSPNGTLHMQAFESSPDSLATTENVSSNLVDNNDNELNCDTVSPNGTKHMQAVDGSPDSLAATENVSSNLVESNDNEPNRDTVSPNGTEHVQAVESSPDSLAATENVSSNLVESNDNEPNRDTVSTVPLAIPGPSNEALAINLKKEYVPLAPTFHTAEVNNLLEEIDSRDDVMVDEYDDDLTFYVNRNVGFGMPLARNDQDLIKYENDSVSGDMPYALTKKGRIYNMGDKQIEVPTKVIDKLKLWNESEEKSGPDYDEYVTIAILLVCVNPDDLARSKISKFVKDFIRGFLKVRANYDDERVSKMDDYIYKYCVSKYKK